MTSLAELIKRVEKIIENTSVKTPITAELEARVAALKKLQK